MINGRNDEDNSWEMTDVTTSRPRVYHALLSWRAGKTEDGNYSYLLSNMAGSERSATDEKMG